jgi:hypothetical protein
MALVAGCLASFFTDDIKTSVPFKWPVYDFGGFCISPRKGIVGIMPPEQWRGPWPRDARKYPSDEVRSKCIVTCN